MKCWCSLKIFSIHSFHYSLKMPWLKCVDERSAIFAVIRAKDWRQVNGGFLTFPPLTADHNHHLSQVGQKSGISKKKLCFDSFASVWCPMQARYYLKRRKYRMFSKRRSLITEKYAACNLSFRPIKLFRL